MNVWEYHLLIALSPLFVELIRFVRAELDYERRQER